MTEPQPSSVVVPSRPETRAWTIAVVVVIVLHGVVAWIAREPGLLTGQDDAEYITLAKSIRQGGYNELFRVDSPVHRVYPPAYPALLAAWGGILGDRFDTLVALNVILSVAALGLLFICVRRVFDVRIAALAVLVVAWNPEIVRFAGGVRSEILYLLATLGALYALIRANGRARWLAIAIIVALSAAATRTVGVTLVGAIALHWLFERRWKLIGIPLLTALLVLGGWLAWTALDPEQHVGSSYIAELRSVWSGIEWTGPLLERAPRYVQMYTSVALPTQLAVPTVPDTPIDNVVSLFILGACLLAGLIVFLRDWRPAGLYLLSYAALLAVWLFAVERFLTPLIPLLVTALLVGGRALGGRLRANLRTIVPIVLASVLLLSGAVRTVGLVGERVRCDRTDRFPDPSCMNEDQRSYFNALVWMEQNLPDDAALLLAKPGALWLYTGHQSIAYEESLGRGPAAFLPWVREQGAEWILLGSLHIGELYRLAPLIRDNCQALRLAASFPPRTYLFRMAADSLGDDAANDACAAADAYFTANADRDFERAR